MEREGHNHDRRDPRAGTIRVTVLALAVGLGAVGSSLAVFATPAAGAEPSSSSTTSPRGRALAATSVDSSCSAAGERQVVDGTTQCACLPGYSGRSCETCAVGYDRTAAGPCVLGATARRAVCFDKGTPYLDPFGNIACRCDAGFSGADCGGPDIAVEGALVSVEAGRSRTLRARGGSGPYEWGVPARRGSLARADAHGAVHVYTAPTDVTRVEIVRVQVRDLGGHRFREFDLTVVPRGSTAITGVPVAELVSFDQAMLDYMKGRGIRAGVVAVAKDGHLVLKRGYGYMDKGADNDPFVHDEGGVGLVGSQTPFRIASITKPITAAALREALEAEGLDTSEPALPWIDVSLGADVNYGPEKWFPYTPGGEPFYVENDLNNAYECPSWQGGSMPDSRWEDITIQHLLSHKGGFDRSLIPSPRWSGGFAPPGWGSDSSYIATSGDPNFKPALMIHDLALNTGLDFTGPLRPKNLVQYMAGVCLAFSPGARREYSNFGYTLLGRVLEGLHGERWEPGSGANRRYGWGPYIDIVDSFLADHGVSGIRAGGTGSFSSENPDGITSDEPYYRHLSADGSEPMYLNVADAFGITNEGGMYFGPSLTVPGPYGAFSMQTMESHGGLVATAPGLIKFMRHFRLEPRSNKDAIGAPRTSVSIGDASHGGLLPGTYGLAWQLPSGTRTYQVPSLDGLWDQTDPNDFFITVPTGCSLPTGVDVVALFAQSSDPKDTGATEYGKIGHFIGKAACLVADWPNPLSPTQDVSGN